MQRQSFNPPGAIYPGVSQAVKVGNLIFVSGQVASDKGAYPCTGDAEAQARLCFANLQEVLRAAGSSLREITKLTCFLTDEAAYPAYARVKAELFPDNAPASTGVLVAGLLAPGALMEIEAIALCAPSGR